MNLVKIGSGGVSTGQHWSGQGSLRISERETAKDSHSLVVPLVAVPLQWAVVTIRKKLWPLVIVWLFQWREEKGQQRDPLENYCSLAGHLHQAVAKEEGEALK
jgi:hypothetical protein